MLDNVIRIDKVFKEICDKPLEKSSKIAIHLNINVSLKNLFSSHFWWILIVWLPI